MATITEIEEKYRELLDQIFFETDEEELAKLYDKLNFVKGTGKEKLSIVSKMLIEAIEITEARKRVYESAKKRYETGKNRVESLREYIKKGMIELNMKKLETDYCTISQRKYEKVVYDEGFDYGQLPEQFKKVKVTVSPMAREIKAALKEGEHIEGVGIIEEKGIMIRR